MFLVFKTLKKILKPKNKFNCILFLFLLIFSILYSLPSQSHLADLSFLDVVIEPKITQINLTLSTHLLPFADEDKNHRLSSEEIQVHQQELQEFLADKLRLSNSQGQKAELTVIIKENRILGTNLPRSNTHSTIKLEYVWPKPVTEIRIDYNLFDKTYNTHCLATILNNGKINNYTLMPKHRVLKIELNQRRGQLLNEGGLITFVVAFSWGAIHALSPGHGKTLVGAYLVGSKAKAKHALFLGLTTTITHTLGVFLLGIVTLMASQYLLPIQFYPWLSLGSGLMIFLIGINLIKTRLAFRVKKTKKQNLFLTEFSYHHHHYHHNHHDHSSNHEHHHSHDHLLPNKEDSFLNWRSLMALGIAGGLVPCPAALVLLLSMIALGQTSFGLLLVFIFSLGLTGTLTVIGLLLVNAKHLFERIPSSIKFVKVLPVISALLIAFIGIGLTYQAVGQIYALTLPIPYAEQSIN